MGKTIRTPTKTSILKASIKNRINTPTKSHKKSITKPDLKKELFSNKNIKKSSVSKFKDIIAPQSKNTAIDPTRYTKVKSILITQPKPASDKSPFFEIAKKYKMKIDWRPCIQLQSITSREFRRMRINLYEITAIIFNSKNSIDHFFKLADELRFKVPADLKYFCIAESVALYLQKFIHYRKRKVFFANGTLDDLKSMLNKYKETEKILFPCSNVRKADIPDFLTKGNYKWYEAVIYKTISADLSDLKDIYYDIIVFYSPADIQSLFDNFPDFKQNNTRIATFGTATAEEVRRRKLILDIEAPLHDTPSMSSAIEKYIIKIGKQ